VQRDQNVCCESEVRVRSSHRRREGRGEKEEKGRACTPCAPGGVDRVAVRVQLHQKLPAPVLAHGTIRHPFQSWRPPQITILTTHPPLPNRPPGLPMTLNVVYTEICQQVNAPLSQQQQQQQQQILEVQITLYIAFYSGNAFVGI
jgi:hypothetical protein